MFQRKIDEISNDKPNVFGITDDISVVGYKDDGRDHNGTLQKVLQRCRKVNLMLYEDKVSFQVYFCHICRRSNIKKWSTRRPTENQGPHGHATPQQ